MKIEIEYIRVGWKKLVDNNFSGFRNGLVHKIVVGILRLWLAYVNCWNSCHGQNSQIKAKLDREREKRRIMPRWWRWCRLRCSCLRSDPSTKTSSSSPFPELSPFKIRGFPHFDVNFSPFDDIEEGMIVTEVTLRLLRHLDQSRFAAGLHSRRCVHLFLLFFNDIKWGLPYPRRDSTEEQRDRQLRRRQSPCEIPNDNGYGDWYGGESRTLSGTEMVNFVFRPVLK